jgi:hypothetical protein
MNKLKKNFGQDDDTRTLLKNLHKKVYSICRLFTSNYASHQSLFTDIIAAASQNLYANKAGEDKEALFLRACINMAALHSISGSLIPGADPAIQFKSPDYQKSMINFREIVGTAKDYEKIRLFLDLEKWPADRSEELSGLRPVDPDPVHPAFRKDRPSFTQPGNEHSRTRANPIPQNNPTLKEKLIWI